jgi:UDP-N-acetylglucosamine 2-epimerase (non-hydrolysing)
MELAPVDRAIRAADPLGPRIIHPGQHDDLAMNEPFFRNLGIPVPSTHLDVGSESRATQTARILERYEAHLVNTPLAAGVVFGDVDSTIAHALAAVKRGIPVCDVEAGLRSFDRMMPARKPRRHGGRTRVVRRPGAVFSLAPLCPSPTPRRPARRPPG